MKQLPFALLLACCSLFTASGCFHHSVPLTQTPNRLSGPQTLQVWVDQNGSFYPNAWLGTFGRPPRIGNTAYSLKTIARQKGLAAELDQAEAEAKNRFTRFVADKTRLFILIHGFNNSEEEANQAYTAIEEQIAFKPTDGVVEFYWDGLVASGVLPAKIWFNATGYSQLAGTRGLRPLLNLTEGKQIVFITHSRGASVLLSALSDPPYRPSFAEDTLRFHGIDVRDNLPLKHNGNRMSCLVLAPAVGLIDFKTPDYYKPDDSFRAFDAQLTDFYQSVNPTDPVLKKYVGLSGAFNPTNLGYDRSTAEVLHAHDPRFHYVVWSGLETHGFVTYVKNPQFRTMLSELGIEVRAGTTNSRSPDGGK